MLWLVGSTVTLAVGTVAPLGKRFDNASDKIFATLAASEARGRKTFVTWMVCERVPAPVPPVPWTGLSSLLISASIWSNWPVTGAATINRF
jgi:hypothetical protein